MEGIPCFAGPAGVKQPAEQPGDRRSLRLAVLGIITTLSALALALAPTYAHAAVAAGDAYKTQANKRFIVIGTHGGGQFSAAQYEQIARNHGIMVFTKFHGGWNIALHHEAARRLKQLNPNLKIFGYMSTKYWLEQSNWGADVINRAWLLRDKQGRLIPTDKKDGGREGYYVDVSNPSYRAWVIGVAKKWMTQAPYSGIRFDAADPIGDYGARNIRQWQRLLTPEKIAAYNAGIRSLLSEASAALPEVFYNGINPNQIRGPGRDLDLLQVSDGAMNETFCSRNGRPEGKDSILADIEIMRSYPNKQINMHVDSPALPSDSAGLADLSRLQRRCVGSFLMGWQPGATRFGTGNGYGTEQLAMPVPDIDLNTGSPTGQHTRQGDLLRRNFDNGVVLVNLGTAPVSVTLSEALTEARDGRLGSARAAGASVTVAPMDSVFLVRISATSPPPGGTTPPPVTTPPPGTTPPPTGGTPPPATQPPSSRLCAALSRIRTTRQSGLLYQLQQACKQRPAISAREFIFSRYGSLTTR